MTTRNGWGLFQFKTFAIILQALVTEVGALARSDPNTYKNHKKTKLLKYVLNLIEDEIPVDPTDKKYFLGKTLGDDFKEWRRAKSGLPNRYRLFFRFSSEQKVIIYVWLNSEGTLRKEGAKTDVYTVFEKMLRKKTVSSDIKSLLDQSTNHLRD